MSRVKVLSVLLAGVFLFGAGQVFAAEDQSKLIEGAKKEGKVVYWSSGLTPDLVQGIEAGFKKKYGLRDFQVVYSHAITTEQIAKVTQELRARRLTVDIISGAMPEFFYDLLKAGELMKYDSPEYKHFPMVKGVCAEPGYWVGTTGMVMAITWNPKKIKKNFATYNELLDPQLKGIMCSGDPRKSESYLMNYLGLRKGLGKDFFTKLAKQDIIWFTRAPDVTNKVMTGEFPVAFMGNSRTAYVNAMEGGDMKVSFPKEGVVILTNPFVILGKAPHPNAARLLVDYVSSDEGQRLMVEKSGYMTLREGVPIPPKAKDFIPPITEIKVVPIDWKSLTRDEVEKTRKEFIEIFGTK